MRFYYASFFSSLLWIVFCAVAIPLFWLIWSKGFDRKFTWRSALISAVVIAMLPWAEEWWIASSFGYYCRKDAGVFVYKTVEVDGYYNGTGAVTRIVDGPAYKFIEGPERGGGYRRVERATEDEKNRAIDIYVKDKGKQPGERDWISETVGGNGKINVEMNTGLAWRFTKLDKPTARYEYRTLQQSARNGYKIRKTEHVVKDIQTGELLGRETVYVRDAYWFFIGLDAPVMVCPDSREKAQYPRGMLYENVLIPKGSK